MELTNYQSYQEYKRELDGELTKTAEGFVRIGYLLKVARDTNILAESGYKSVAEFAQAEYSLDKTQVSRFISINDKFSEGGNSDRLLPEFQGYGYAKLTIMLQIPEEITRELTPGYSKAEIQAIKEELDEEKKVSDLEILMEEREEEEEGTLYRTLKQLGHDDPVLWENLWNVRMPFLTWGEIGEIMAPSGDKVYSVRILGEGRVMMTMKDGEDVVVITNTRTFKKETYTKQMVANEWTRLLKEEETAGKAWEKVYAEPWPYTKVVPVQQRKENTRESLKEQSKKQAKKESKVSKAKVPEKPKKPSTEPAQTAVVEEPQIEGQMSVKDYPELMPDGEENDGKDARMDAGDVQSGESDRSGDETADGGSKATEGTEGDEIQGSDEGDGAPEGGGCEADHGYKEMNPFWEALEDIGNAMERLEAMFPEEDFHDKLDAMNIEELKAAHKEALKLAAGIEKMMIWRHLKNEG